MSNLVDKFFAITRQLLPHGRAFRMSDQSTKKKLEKALINLEIQFYNDANAILFSILPDNDNFTSDDATRWEQRLGLITNLSVSLADRKAAIIRKMNHPGNILARQSAGYIQDQLQLAGFNVWVHENPDGISMFELFSIYGDIAQFGNFQWGQQQWGDAFSYYSDLFNYLQWGQFQWGQTQFGSHNYNNVIANSIDEQKDAWFLFSNLNRSFFVGGQQFGTFASVPVERKDEFRQLILKLKPAQTVGFLLINYV